MAAPIGYAQNVSFNTTGISPNSSAVLDLSACTNGGFLMPCVPNSAIIAGGNLQPTNPLPTSLLIFNVTTGCYYAYYAGGAAWKQEFCLCSGGPAAPGAITGTTAVTNGSVYTYSITAISGATSYTWTLPSGCTIETGATTNSITALMACTAGNITVSANNACGSTAGTTPLAITISSTTPVAPSAPTGSATICASSTGNVYTVTPVTGATSYTWNVPAAVGTITAGSGTNTITVTAASGAGSGNITVQTNFACGSASTASAALAVTVEASLTAPTVTGTTPITTNSTGNVFSVPSIAGVTYTWTVPSQIGTITAGAGTNSITVTAAGSAETTYSITVQESNVCNTVTTNYAVSVTTCTPAAVTLDTKVKSGVGTSVFNITTTGTNELVVVACSGYANSNPVNFTGSVAVNQGVGAATLYNGISTQDAEIKVYWFVAPTAQTYQITVTETGYTEYDNFAAALKGMCSPGAADFVHNASNTLSNFGGNSWQISASLTENASSYALGFYTDYWQTSPTPTWANTSDFVTSDANGGGRDDYSMWGEAITSAATPTITAEEGGSGYIDYACVYLIDIK
ncbi:MAG TPA: hypothetical protein VK783_00140 [Bacteroidia bacterium]|jgi:hypothetical protein|nr:hypothetical protein [Bacteroidia bacterium]